MVSTFVSTLVLPSNMIENDPIYIYMYIYIYIYLACSKLILNDYPVYGLADYGLACRFILDQGNKNHVYNPMASSGL